LKVPFNFIISNILLPDYIKAVVSVFHHLYDYAIYYFNLKDILLYLMFNIKTHFMLSYFPLSFPWRFCSLVADWTMWLWRHVLIIFLHNCIVNFCIKRKNLSNSIINKKKSLPQINIHIVWLTIHSCQTDEGRVIQVIQIFIHYSNLVQQYGLEISNKPWNLRIKRFNLTSEKLTWSWMAFFLSQEFLLLFNVTSLINSIFIFYGNKCVNNNILLDIIKWFYY
jgi:hypothetical protein